MGSRATGPLGMLLLIAPLVAIPVFAVVGVPQFAPLVATVADDTTGSSVEPWLPQSPQASLAEPTPSRPADDLFAPLTAEGKAAPANPRVADANPKSDPFKFNFDNLDVADETPTNGLAPLHPPGDGHVEDLSGGESQGIPPGALDGFEFEPERRPAPPRRDAPRQLSRTLPDNLTPPGRGANLGADYGNSAGLGDSADTKVRQPRMSPNPPATSGTLTWLGASRRLKALGVRSYHLDAVMDQDQFVFRCDLPDPENPRRVTVQDAEPLQAVAKAIALIERAMR